MIKNNRKILYFIFFLVFIYFAIIIIGVLNNKKYTKMIFIGDFTKVEIKNEDILVYNKNDKIDNQAVKLYFNGNIIDGYISSKESGSNGGDYMYIAYNDNGSSLYFDNSIIAFTKDLDLNFKKISNQEGTDLNEVTDFFKDLNIDINSDIEIENYLISTFDYDNDGQEEKIYSVDFFEDIEDETDASLGEGIAEEEMMEKNYYSYVFMKKDNKYILLDKEESIYDGVHNVRLKFENLIDFNNDNKYEFVISKMMSEYGPDYFELYNFDGTKFIKIGGE